MKCEHCGASMWWIADKDSAEGHYHMCFKCDAIYPKRRVHNYSMDGE